MKKKISFLLAAIMILSSVMFSLPASAASAEDQYAILCSLGFFDTDAIYTPNTSVNRGELVEALVRAMPEEKYQTFSGTDTGFSDISANDPIAETAYNARLLGLAGDEKELKPYELATLEDVSFMILNVLGYGKAIKSDYAAYASSIGLTKSLPNASRFTKAQLVSMLYQALDTEILQWELTTESGKLSTEKGKTYLTEILSAGKGRGQVTATKYAAVAGAEPTNRNETVIGGAAYQIDTVSTDELLGETVDYYYRTVQDEDVLVYAKARNADRCLTIDAEELEDFENLTYRYTPANSNRSKNASILKTSDLIYNGKNVRGAFEKYVPEVGSVKLIDDNGDGKYETVIITDYAVVVVNGVDKENGVVRDKFYPDREFSVDLYAAEPAYQVLTQNGRIRKFTDIEKGNVIFASQSLDGALTTFVIPERKSIRGSVESISEDTIKIDGIVYEVTDDFFGKNPDTQEVYNVVRVRSNGIFYLDPYGRVGYFETLGDKSIKAGYLIKASVADEGEEDFECLMIKMFTESGSMEKLYTAKKLKYTNGRKLDTKGHIDTDYDQVKVPNGAITIEDLADELNQCRDDVLGGGQLILFKQNNDGRITELYIPIAYNEDISYDLESYYDKNEDFRQSSAKIKKTQKNGMFMSMSSNDFRIGENTKVFSIPSDLDKTSMFQIYTGTTNCFAWNTEYNVVAFKKNTDSSYADYIVGFLGGNNAVQNQDNVFIVNSVGEGLNEDEEAVPVLKGLWTGRTANSEMQFAVSSEAMDSLQYEILPGNIYALALDESNQVVNMKEVCVPSMNYASGSWGDMNYAVPFYRAAYDIKGKTLITSPAAAPDVQKISDTSVFFADQFKYVYKYNTQNNKVTSADYTDLKTYRQNPSGYSKVFTMLFCGDDIVMVIYE